jgi:hypothetical protein
VLNGIAAVLVAACLATRSSAADAPALGARPVAVRVAWGGGQPQAWAGTVMLVREGTDQPADVGAWRSLSTEADAAATTRPENGTIAVDQRRPVASDGVEITVPDVHGWRVRAALGPAAAGRPTATIDVAVADLLVEPAQQPLDGDGNRLSVRPGPGESLRVTWETGRDSAGRSAIHRPGERLRWVVEPLLPARGDGSTVELRMRLRAAADTAPVAAQAVTLEPVVDASAAHEQPAARRVVRFRSVAFDVPLPDREGVWEVDLEAVERGGMRWSRPVATRTVQVVAVADAPPVEAAAEWKVVYELDPGSPRLHERLRRLPGVGLSSVPLPSVPLPTFARPGAVLQRLPSVPVPAVPLPSAASISALVPRLSGLLATGHSRLELHELGPLLKLPPAAAATSPAWEGIVIAGAQPGRPHAVEIEFPTDQEAVLGVSVLELDADHAAVRSRHAGGFRVTPERFPSGPPRLDVHRFVFWPTTRHPLIVISNSEPGAAVFGRVRILAGPGRLPAAEPIAGRRLVHAFLATPDFTEFGAIGRRGREGGRPATDWLSHLTGIDQATQCLAAQGAAGAMVTVHARGAALWPSAATRHAPRWDSGTPSESGLDAEPKDVLALVVRLFGRAGLRLVPALEFTAPLASLESLVARGGAEAAGILCVGRDGRPVRGDATAGYNVLDPRVQAAVEEVVVELAGRLAGPDAGVVDGVALLMPHDGWLHLPGVAWGLDDATFARFLATIGEADVATVPAADGRFSARAALVEGPLRDRWLEWRAGEIARFHGRLADRLAEIQPRWSLSLVPTTLLVAGEQAARFRPHVGREVPADVLGELGLDPARSTAHRRVVFVGPHVRGGGGLTEDAAVAAANRAAVAGAATGAARRAALLLDQSRPLAVAGIVAHGPFGGAASADVARVHALATGGARDRGLAESFVAADLEAVYDTALTLECPSAPPGGRMAMAALPTVRLSAVDRLPAPLVVRQARDGDATWVHVVNAAAAPVRATLALDGRAEEAADGVDGGALPLETPGVVAVDLPAWGMRAVRLSGGAAVRRADVAYDESIAEAVARGVEGMKRRRATLESPVPIEALDNAGFELSAAQDPAPSGGPLPGWELLEPRRGSLAVVAGAAGGRAAGFSSVHGLATLRSNPFSPPASGRLSIAAWLRVRPGDPQPPLRIAIEGVQGDREYYRYAAVGGLAGGRPLAADWSQFVLQIDDLPASGLESLRVRFDLLGPGAVEIDDVRVFDLAFDESQRVQLSRLVSRAEQCLAAGDLGGCVLELDGHWPRYLEAFVPLPAEPVAAEAGPAPSPPAERTGVLERMWRLWQ